MKYTFYTIFVIIGFLSPVIFPIIGILGYINDFSIMIFIGGIYSVFYFISNIAKAKSILFTILILLAAFFNADSVDGYMFYLSVGAIADFATNLISIIFTCVINKLSKKSKQELSEN